MDYQESTYTLQSTYTPTLNSNATILNLTLKSLAPSLKKSNKYVLIVLDISGSMSGAKLQTSKDAICGLIKTLYDTHAHPKVDLITFNSFPNFISLKRKSYSECVKQIGQIEAGGGTNFIPVFKLIKNLLKQGQESEAHAKGKKVKLDETTYGTNSNHEAIEEVAVVFLSDGEGEELSELKPYIEKMRNFAEEKLSSAEFHTLGFGSDHDARLLEELTKSMPNQGTFQYVRESAEIAECIQNVSSCMMGRRLNAFVSWIDEGDVQQKKVNFAVKKQSMEEEDQKEVNWEGVVFINKSLAQFEALKDALVLNIKQEEGYKTLNIVAEYKQPEEKVTEMYQNFFYINEELKKISDAIISGEKFNAKKAEEYRDHVAGYRVMLNELMRGLFKLKIDERNSVMDRAKDLNEYMDKIGELLRTSANKGLTNDQIASVNALAYRQVTRNSNLKTLDKRTLQNVDLLNQVTEKVKETASKFDEKEFTNKYEALIDEVGCCALNLSNIPEALKSQDCLCLTFDMTRPEVAIQDASRIIIKKIYPTMICATAFLDSVKFSMKLNPNNSGGFDPAFQGGDGIVKGASNESITGAMPLYFCAEHWQAASQYIKPILGWDVTLDPLGYDYNQVRTVPFLLLITALNDKNKNPNEFNLRVHKWILDTCCQIIKDEISQNPNSNLVKLVEPIWEKYDKFGTLRGVDAAQNSNVLLAHVYCLQEMGLMQKDPEEVFVKKIGYLVEEEMRRRQDKAKIWNSSQIRKSIKQIMDIDTAYYAGLIRGEDKLDKMIEEPMKQTSSESFEAKEKRFVGLYQKIKAIQPKKNKLALKLERENRNREKAEKNKQKNKENSKEFQLNVPKEIVEKLKTLGFKIEDKFPTSFDQFGKVQKEHATQAFQNFKNATRFTKSWRKTWGYPEQELRKIESIGIMTPIQLFALYIQNKIHSKNSDRQDSFVNKQYVDPFDQKASEEYLYTLAAQVVYERMLKEENEKPKEMNCPFEDIEFFAKTMNLEAAAGVLVNGFNLGSHEALQHILRHSSDKCWRVFEKLKMIKNCEYKGVSFEFDFKMKKKFLRQLYKKYEGKHSYEEWKELWYKEKQTRRV